MKKIHVAITIGIMCFLLTIGIIIQVNTINEAGNTIGTSKLNDNLKDEVLRWKERYDSTYSVLLKEQTELESVREAVTKRDTNSEGYEKEIKTANKILGLTDVNGTGITITIADSQITNSQLAGIIDVDSLLVHYSDLIQVINELKNAGAEAISVNDERIVPTTAITCDGNVILVNGQKIGSPFVIKAIGNPEMLLGITRPGGYISLMEGDGIEINIKKSDNITISKYNGVISSKYLKNN